jgi:hypothetical protein
MFVQKVAVQELDVGPVADVLVVPFLAVHHFVALNGIESGEETPCEGEDINIESSFRSAVEEPVVNFDDVREDYELPDPSKRFQEVVSVQRDPEPLVVQESLFTLGGQVGVVWRNEQSCQRVDPVNHPNDN